MPQLDTANKIIYYDSCRPNLYAAVRRQCTAVPGPDDDFMDRLEQYFDHTIFPEITELLSHFHYSVPVWYNHLDSKQQHEIDRVDLATLDTRFATIFCKCEKQEIPLNPVTQIGELPKNRTISAMCTQHKYVMGPVIYALEQYFKKFKGYCGGKTWKELGEMYDSWHSKGWTKLIQSDISGMDRSVKRRLLALIEKIYAYLTPFIHHVDPITWQKHAFVSKTKIFATYYEDKHLNDMGYCMVTDTVFSGESSTTWKNTLINIIIMRYIFEILLGLQPDEYGLANKGDDSGAALPPSFDNKIIRKAFYTVYYDASLIKHPYAPIYLKHGCGLTLKFLGICDTLTDIDFCSTNTYYCNVCNHHRVTRKLDRFITLTPWSDTAHNLTKTQRLAYMENLYLSNLKWCKNLPIFSNLNNKLHTGVKTKYTLNGKPRRKLALNETDSKWFHELFNTKHIAQTENYQRQFGKHLAYSMIQQDADILDCCAGSYYNWLRDKLDLDRQSVDQIMRDIDNATGDIFSSPLLSIGLHNLQQYFDRTYDDTSDVNCLPELAG
jgi:hypothetical protein